MDKLGYMAVDQYGNSYHWLKCPRRDLLARLSSKHADKLYRDDVTTGQARHIGYIIAGLRLEVFTVSKWAGV